MMDVVIGDRRTNSILHHISRLRLQNIRRLMEKSKLCMILTSLDILEYMNVIHKYYCVEWSWNTTLDFVVNPPVRLLKSKYLSDHRRAWPPERESEVPCRPLRSTDLWNEHRRIIHDNMQSRGEADVLRV